MLGEIVVNRWRLRATQWSRAMITRARNPLGLEAIYTEAKIENAVAAFGSPYATLDSGAETYAFGGTTGTLA
jgi:hypothetical protein